MKKEIICTVCPVGCNLIVEGEGESITSITGNECNRGLEYGKNEFAHPVRILTTTVKVEGSSEELLSVRSNKPVPKELLMDCMEKIREVKIYPPVKSKSIIISDICGCGADIVATASIK